MTDDEKQKQARQLFDGHAQEIMRVLREYQDEAVNGHDLFDVWTRRGKALAVLIHQQRRMIDHLAGRPVQPEHHEAEGVLVGVLGEWKE